MKGARPFGTLVRGERAKKRTDGESRRPVEACAVQIVNLSVEDVRHGRQMRSINQPLIAHSTGEL